MTSNLRKYRINPYIYDRIVIEKSQQKTFILQYFPYFARVKPIFLLE